uniref:DUF1281 family ferredoxin-like fold protein n=1 Tax=Pedobacter schmidteae TaxID=2201271 RepID=UPI000EB22193|nr:hypothetical protein [Pedobacter schmidteae]
MANWCLNTVKFEANEAVMNELRTLFLRMAEKEILENKGQLPAGYEGSSGYLFEIEMEEDTLSYLTKWAPNTDVIIFMAKQYGAGFIYNYEEPGMAIYGVTFYRNEQLQDICLDEEDFKCYQYNETDENYTFEGEVFPDDWDIMEILLQRKVKRMYKP